MEGGWAAVEGAGAGGRGEGEGVRAGRVGESERPAVCIPA